MLARQIDMRDLRQRMDAGIGAPGAMHRDASRRRTASTASSSACLHREPVRLALPADEAGAVIFDGQLVAGHGSTVPGGSAKPRRKAAASMRAAARPLQPRRAQRAVAAGDRQALVEHRARAAPLPSRLDVGRQHADALAAAARTRRRATGRRRAPGARARTAGRRQSSRASSRRSFGGVGDARRPAAAAAPARRAPARRAPRRSACAPSAASVVGQAAGGRRPARSASPRAAASGRCRAPASICMMVTPVSRSPARIARWIGAAPRQRGSSEAWTLRQPRRGASRIGVGRISP